MRIAEWGFRFSAPSPKLCRGPTGPGRAGKGKPMSIAERLLQDGWDHDEGAHRIEELAAYNPGLGDRLGRLALRYISEKGLSGEFADVLDEIERIEADRPADLAP